MRKPIIGITTECSHDPEEPRTRGQIELNWNYFQAVSEAGGVPIVIPPTADPCTISALLDGWLISGGKDIAGERFGQGTHPEAELQNPARFELEAKLYDALRPETPIFGICYGCQLLNVLRGGNLHQHLPEIVPNSVHTGGPMQHYQLAATSKIASIVGSPSVEGKSFHHQAVDRLGESLVATAWHEDGTIEAIEATDRPFLIATQWHPERTIDDVASQRLFQAFIRAAESFAAEKDGRIG
jgi:putative glutamine amidotransferase